MMDILIDFLLHPLVVWFLLVVDLFVLFGLSAHTCPISRSDRGGK